MKKTFPRLPSGSVDLSALHEAEARGRDLDEALAKATTRVEPPKPDAKAKPAPAAKPDANEPAAPAAD